MAALVVFLGTARAASQNLVVDDDASECPTAPYAEIDEAVADANPGDTIVVCPGEYLPATISTRVVVRGFTPNLSSASKCESVDVQNSAEDSIVAGLVIAANKVTVTGLTLTGADNGVLIPGSSSTVGVTGNVIEQNAIGINMNGGFITADHNCIRDNNETGSGSGTGIYSDQGLRNSSIVGNAFRDNEAGAAITLLGDGAGSVSSVKVDRNSSSGDGDLINISGVTNSSITNNSAIGSAGSAIYIVDGNSGILVEKNTLQAGEDEGIAIDADGGIENEVLTISNNKVTANDGLSGADAGLAVYENSLLDSTLSKNTVTGNTGDGLHIESGNSGNLIEKNKLQKNFGTWDCFDDPGNANTWKSNKGKTQNRDGLCKGAKTVP